MHSRAVLGCCLPVSAAAVLRGEMGSPCVGAPPVGYYLPPHCCPSPGPSSPPPQVTAQLESEELWEKFNSVGTEMILTKSGRRMFPELSVSVSGLDPHSLYALCAEAVPEGDARYKWRGGTWCKTCRAEPGPPTRLYLHPESPAPGHRWMDRPVCFSKIRLTNNTLSQGAQIVLQSMHRYSLRLYIIPTSSQGSHVEAVSCVSFPETSFIAVTSYQNPRLSLLKIEENPFAKGIKYFKHQQENPIPGKRPSRVPQSRERGAECKKFKESAEVREAREPARVESAEKREEKQLVSEEKAEMGEERQLVTGKSAAIKERRHTAMGGRHSEEITETGEERHPTTEDSMERREEKPQGRDITVSETAVPWSSMAQRQPWMSPSAVSPLTLTPYSACLMGYRIAQPHHSSFAPLTPPASYMRPLCSAPPFLAGAWAPTPLSSPLPGLHPQLLQQICPPHWYLPPPSPCRGL